MTDLTEYVDAAARALRAAERPNGPGFDEVTPLEQYRYREYVTPLVAAVAPLIERDARAAALEEAAGQCDVDAGDWYGTYVFADIDADMAVIRAAMQGRGKDIDNVSAHMFRRALRARARILRDRAQAIREGR